MDRNMRWSARHSSGTVYVPIGHVESPVWIETGDLSVGSAFLIHHLDGRTLAADTIESLLQELSV